MLGMGSEMFICICKWQLNGFSILSLAETVLCVIITYFILMNFTIVESTWENNPLFSNNFAQQFTLARYITLLFAVIYFVSHYIEIHHALQSGGVALSKIKFAFLDQATFIASFYFASCTPKPPKANLSHL